LRAILLVVSALALSAWLGAQVANPGVVRGAFTFPEYDPQNPGRLKSLLTGVGAKPLSGGQILLSELRFEAYASGGGTNLVIRGTNCVFDPKTRTACSPGWFDFRSGDGQLAIEGVGFTWYQSNSHLVVSNRVRALIHTGVTAPRLIEK
jgi:hypothetical protein